jgi:hypothetical protein
MDRLVKKHLDLGSVSVILITFLLFTFALFTKGTTHDILLEAGVLLISIKLIMMAYKTAVFYEEIIRELKKLNDCLKKNT